MQTVEEYIKQDPVEWISAPTSGKKQTVRAILNAIKCMKEEGKMGIDLDVFAKLIVLELNK